MTPILKTLIAVVLAVGGLRSIYFDIKTMIMNDAPSIDKDTALSKRLLAPYTRYWIGRYYAPFNGLISGLLLIGIAVLVYFS